ncbi:hypothetical protein A2397_05825 [Candidatus Amesbacteria bacterium RIFOXYB1_FULL_44_23]|uniref:Uncharacterized protein n=1 Tax=Candidatus Amesbacteria bacterium RIFOXYB1_FULL_44_23 TaxID=1797263 RepID=A0A1F4ZUC4_9BACT|nr:MAG: hypothetical protein A2397_05825 [Candidatus Amesbacteria bacterium RIFOXYB1_FULL_44_23]
MAVKRTSKKVKTSAPVEKFEVAPTLPHLVNTESKPVMKSWKGLAIAAAVLGAIVLFWYKTDTWPIVAMVGLRPVTRMEVDMALFSRSGKVEVDNRVTELQIKAELARLGIKVTASEVDAKIAEIKANLGENADLETLLLARGMKMSDYRKQLELLLGAEKAVADKLVVTDEEVSAYLTENKDLFADASQEAKVKEATDTLRLSKIDQEISGWVNEVRTKSKAWVLPSLRVSTSGI